MNLIFKYNGNEKLLNIFRDNQILAYSDPTAVSYDELKISDVLAKKCYYVNDKCVPELSEFFKI